MVDYSRAATSKAAKASFDKAAQSLIAEIQELQAEYETEWKKVEELRKSRASLIENVIPILKRNEVKLVRPLSKCDNSELMQALRDTVNSLDTTPQEEVKVAMVRIESRYGQLVNQAKKLDALYERLSSYYVPEKDYGDEVVISLKDRKKKQEETKAMEETPVVEEIEQVVIEPALAEEELPLVLEDVPEEIQAEAPVIVDDMIAGEHVDDEPTMEVIEEEIPEETIEEDDAVALEVSETPLFQVTTFEVVPDLDTPEIVPREDYPTIKYVEDKEDEEEYTLSDFSSIFQGVNLEEEEAVPFADEGMEQVISSAPASPELIEQVDALIDSKKLYGFLDNLGEPEAAIEVEQEVQDEEPKVSSPVQEEVEEIDSQLEDDEPEFHTYALNERQTLSEIVDYVYEKTLTWYDLYRYADNGEVINARCEELGINIEDAVNTPGALANLDLKYPKNFVPYDEVENTYLKAA